MAVECQFAVVSTAGCGGYVIYDFGIEQTLRLHEDCELERIYSYTVFFKARNGRTA